MLAPPNRTEPGCNRVERMDQEENQELTQTGGGAAVDADDVRRAGAGLLTVLDELNPAAQKPVELLRTLYTRTLEYLDGGVAVAEARFTADELNASIKNQPEGADASEVAARYVRTNANGLHTLLAERRAEIDQRLRGLGERHRVVIQKTESRGRHKSYYYLGLEPVNQEDAATARTELSASHIRYRVAQTPKAVSWAAPLLRIKLDRNSMSWYAYSVGLALLLLTGLTVIMAPFVSGYWSGSATLLAACIAGMGYAAFGPFYLVIDRGITMAPMWVLRLTVPFAQIELRPTDRLRPDGKLVNEIRLVRYEGTCPICQGSVEVRSGGLAYRGRLIGRCDNAPREHVFSFDHITKIGVPLHANGYYGPPT